MTGTRAGRLRTESLRQQLSLSAFGLNNKLYPQPLGLVFAADCIYRKRSIRSLSFKSATKARSTAEAKESEERGPIGVPIARV
jgi:hypothetical protein